MKERWGSRCTNRDARVQRLLILAVRKHRGRLFHQRPHIPQISHDEFLSKFGFYLILDGGFPSFDLDLGTRRVPGEVSPPTPPN